MTALPRGYSDIFWKPSSNMKGWSTLTTKRKYQDQWDLVSLLLRADYLFIRNFIYQSHLLKIQQTLIYIIYSTDFKHLLKILNINSNFSIYLGNFIVFKVIVEKQLVRYWWK